MSHPPDPFSAPSASPAFHPPDDAEASVTDVLPYDAREVHLVLCATAVSRFMEKDRARVVCFRCGEPGHVRSQCLTHKVRLCLRYETNECTNESCSFAHGESELRQPWKQRCVRVVKHEGQLVCIGCNSSFHTFRNCPLHKDLMLL